MVPSNDVLSPVTTPCPPGLMLVPTFAPCSQLQCYKRLAPIGGLSKQEHQKAFQQLSDIWSSDYLE